MRTLLQEDKKYLNGISKEAKNAVSIIVLFVQFVSSEMDEISVLIYTTHDYFRWRRVSHDAVPFLAWEKNNARKKGQLTFAEYLSFCFFCVNCCVGMCVIQTRKPPKTTIFYHIPVGFFDPESRSYVAFYYRHITVQRACKFEEAQVFFPFPKNKMIKMPKKLCAVQYVVGVESR